MCKLTSLDPFGYSHLLNVIAGHM